MREEKLTSHDQSSLEKEARALARLLIYATADARELGSEEVAIRIEEAVEGLKGRFSLKDSDILPPGQTSH